jgi:hypothetical protein
MQSCTAARSNAFSESLSVTRGRLKNLENVKFLGTISLYQRRRSRVADCSCSNIDDDSGPRKSRLLKSTNCSEVDEIRLIDIDRERRRLSSFVFSLKKVWFLFGFVLTDRRVQKYV